MYRNTRVEVISTSYVVHKVALRRLHYVPYASVNRPLVEPEENDGRGILYTVSVYFRK